MGDKSRAAARKVEQHLAAVERGGGVEIGALVLAGGHDRVLGAEQFVEALARDMLPFLQAGDRDVQPHRRHRHRGDALEVPLDRAVALRVRPGQIAGRGLAVVDDFVVELVARDVPLLLGRELDPRVQAEDHVARDDPAVALGSSEFELHRQVPPPSRRMTG